MRKLYVTYNYATSKGYGMGRRYFEITGAPIDPSFSQILEMERVCLEEIQADEPGASKLYLTNWKWLSPD